LYDSVDKRNTQEMILELPTKQNFVRPCFFDKTHALGIFQAACLPWSVKNIEDLPDDSVSN